ncbi:MAG: adenine nucleotide alpha hydrolase [Actinomycetota bacterium]|nr:MAG: adenine nucleotide alpha hydrolase [Actinomycetota bacterium]
MSARTETPTIVRLEARIRGYGPRAVVAFSGGVDSSVVLAIAARALGAQAVEAVTALSPSYPSGELELARRTAAVLGVAHRTVRTREVEREAYARNDELRCFHCKAELYGVLGRIAQEAGGAVVLAGANADDLGDVRPGLRAGELAGVRNPLLEEGVGKAEVRAIARALGLEVADKPALACLSSRVRTGLRITPELLARIDRAEGVIRRLGFELVRVRHRGEIATVEVAPDEVDRLLAHPGLAGALAELRSLGWREVRVDPDGYRQGNARR